MKKKFVQQMSLMLVSAVILPTTLLAHGGRTDGQGGHKDNKNASGLGYYHYHCGGYPAHLHSQGNCPYDGSSNVTSKPQVSTTQQAKPAPAKPAYQTVTSKFKIGGQYLEISGINQNGNTLVEMRPLCEALGITIAWDGTTSTATCYKDKDSFVLTIGSKSAKINGEKIALEVAPKMVNNKTLLPARFVAEAIGKYVSYNASTGIIEIY